MKEPKKDSDGKKSDKTYVIIAVENYLYRRGLERIISRAKDDSYVVFNLVQLNDFNEQDFDEIDSNPDFPVLVLLSSSGDDPNSIGRIEAIKSRIARSRVIVLSLKSNRNHLFQCISQGADGYLLSDASEDVLLDTMRLVRIGQNVFPSQVGNLIDGSRSNFSSSRDIGKEVGIIDSRSFSSRESRVLGCLASGMSNKEISQALEVAEATVKLTVRNTLAKIRAKNRVQAAVWATKNGFNYIEPSPSQQNRQTPKRRLPSQH